MSRVPYVRFYSDDWLSGTSSLSLEEKGALITICSLISSTGERPKAEYTRLARDLGCTKGRAEKLVKSLVDLGKITIIDGRISNYRAEFEANYSKEMSQKQSQRASNSRKKSDNLCNKNNDTPLAAAKPRLSQPEPEPYIPPSPLQGGIPFEDFYDAYPLEHRLYRDRAESAWCQLTDSEKQQALSALSQIIPKTTPAVFIRSRVFETVKPLKPIEVPNEGTDLRALFDLVCAESENGINSWTTFGDGRVVVEGKTIKPRSQVAGRVINENFGTILKRHGYEVAA